MDTSKETRYFILDCNGEIIGNPNGYRTFIGAERQQNGKLSALIWERYNARENIESNVLNQIVCRSV